MFPTTLNLHNYLAYAVLLLVTLFTFYSLWGWLNGRKFQIRDKKFGLAAMLAVHIQFTLGLVLYLVSPTVQQAFKDFGLAMKSSSLRLSALEHPLVMLIAAVHQDKKKRLQLSPQDELYPVRHCPAAHPLPHPVGQVAWAVVRHADQQTQAHCPWFQSWEKSRPRM
jgi:hypothetical protein